MSRITDFIFGKPGSMHRKMDEDLWNYLGQYRGGDPGNIGVSQEENRYIGGFLDNYVGHWAPTTYKFIKPLVKYAFKLRK